MGLRRPVGPTDLIHEWLAATADPARRDALMTWCVAVSQGPELVTHEVYEKGRRRVFMSHLHSARTRVSFLVFDSPVRAVHIVEISDDEYDPFAGRLD